MKFKEISNKIKNVDIKYIFSLSPASFLRLNSASGSLVSAQVTKAAVLASLGFTCPINHGNGDYFALCGRRDYCVRTTVRRYSTDANANTDSVLITKFQHHSGAYDVKWAIDDLPSGQWVELKMDVNGFCDGFDVSDTFLFEIHLLKELYLYIWCRSCSYITVIEYKVITGMPLYGQ